jgi:hypothetical protein
MSMTNDEAEETFLGTYFGKDLRDMSRGQLMLAVVQLARRETDLMKKHNEALEFLG